MSEPCRIIGILDDGYSGLTAAARSHLERADLVIGAARTLDLVAPILAPTSERRSLDGHLPQVADWVAEARAQGRSSVVLATGDPLFHGIAGSLITRLGLASCVVLPNLSTLQLALARWGMPWQEAQLLSVHSRDSGEWSPGAGPEHGLYRLAQALHQQRLLGVLTSPANGPDRIARLLLAEGLAECFTMRIAERLHQSDERLLGPLPPRECAAQPFAGPNVVLLERIEPIRQPQLFGLPDEAYLQRRPQRGLITRQEVRAVTLARLRLRLDSVLWDIGAGSGSVGLEAARLCRQGHVYAIEKNAEDYAIAAENRRRLGLANYTLHHGRAPAGLSRWPDPDAVFIGGSGGELPILIGIALARLKAEGTLVMNFVTLEHLAEALTELKAQRAHWEVLQLQSARSRPLLDLHRMQAENPVWIVIAERTP